MSYYNPHYKYREAEPGFEQNPALERGHEGSSEESIEVILPESERLVPFVGKVNREVTLEELADLDPNELKEIWDSLGTTHG